MTELRRGLPPLPALMQHLPLDPRGYPVPWFVEKVDGKFDFRVTSRQKAWRAQKERLCWICGLGGGHAMAFVIGPMCAVNRNTSEPGSHLACAEFAVKACPFMTRPDAQYRSAGLPADGRFPPASLEGNPGASCIWVTRRWSPYKVEKDFLIRLGDPTSVTWWCEGVPASREQIDAVLEARLPLLWNVAREQGPLAEGALQSAIDTCKLLLPPPSVPVP